LENCDPKIE